MAIEDYIADQQHQGFLDSEGTFTIDSLKAEQKLIDFHENHPGLWILPLLQAASAAGSTWVSVKILRTSVEIQFSTSHQLSPFPLSGERNEYTEFFRRGVQGAVCGESSFEKFSILSQCPQARSGISIWERGKPAEETLLDCPELLQEVQDSLHSGVECRSKVLVQVTIRSDSWLSSLRSSMRFRADLSSALNKRLDFSVIPVILDGKRMGLGSNKAYKSVAAEYILASKFHDSFVREPEPGCGAEFFDVFGKDVVGLKDQGRFLVRWSRVEDPLFEPIPDPAIHLELGTARARRLAVLNPTKQSDEGEIPIISQGDDGKYLARDIIKFKPEFQLARPRSWVGIHQGFPVSVLLVVPPNPGRAKDCCIYFHRRGIFLEKIPINLLYPGAWCIVACPKIKTDFSGLRIVRDATFIELERFLNLRLKLLIEKTLRLAKARGKKLSALDKWAKSQENIDWE